MEHKKSLSIALISFFNITAVSAALAESGPYIGLQVGVNNFSYQKHLTQTDTFGLVEKVNHDSAFFGEEYGGYIGYGVSLPQNIHLAAEISAEVTNLSRTYSDDLPNAMLQYSVGVKERVKQTYGFSVLPGFCLANHTLIYLKLGILDTRVTSTSEQDGGMLGYTGHFDQYRHGYDLGAGTEIPLADHWRLRGEYDHKFYPSFTKTAPVLNQPEDNLTVTSTRYRLKGDAVKVGITYDFA